MTFVSMTFLVWNFSYNFNIWAWKIFNFKICTNSLISCMELKKKVVKSTNIDVLIPKTLYQQNNFNKFQQIIWIWMHWMKCLRVINLPYYLFLMSRINCFGLIVLFCFVCHWNRSIFKYFKQLLIVFISYYTQIEALISNHA